MADENMSFLPEDYVERRIERRTNLICLSLFVIVLLGIGAGYMVTTRQRAEVKQQAAQVDESFNEAARRLEQLDELQAQREQMLQKAQVASTLLEPVPRTFLMADLINRMPPTLSLFEVSLSSREIKSSAARRVGRRSALENADDDDDARPAAPSVPRQEVSLSMIGVAPTDVQVAQYMSTLSNSQLVDDVNLIYSERTEIQETTMRRFEIRMTLDRAADVRRMDPKQLDRQPGRNPLGEPSLTEKQMLQQAAEDEASGEDADAILPFADGLNATEHLEAPAEGRE